jgi:hypothetical protein
MYLYFKDDGKLFLKSKVQENDLETTYTKKLKVPNDFILTKKIIDNSDTDTNGTEIEVEMNYDEVVSALSYTEKRSVEYPSIENQLDDLFHNGIDGWRTTIQAIKDKYPKENS